VLNSGIRDQRPARGEADWENAEVVRKTKKKRDERKPRRFIVESPVEEYGERPE
jgi:hypothetical protein